MSKNPEIAGEPAAAPGSAQKVLGGKRPDRVYRPFERLRALSTDLYLPALPSMAKYLTPRPF